MQVRGKMALHFYMHLIGHYTLLRQHHVLRATRDQWFYPHHNEQIWINYLLLNAFQAHPGDFNNLELTCQL